MREYVDLPTAVSQPKTPHSSLRKISLSLTSVAPVALVAVCVGFRIAKAKWTKWRSRFRVAYIRERVVEEQMERLIFHTSGVCLLTVEAREVYDPVVAIVDELILRQGWNNNAGSPSTVSSSSGTPTTSVEPHYTRCPSVPSRVLAPLNAPPRQRSTPSNSPPPCVAAAEASHVPTQYRHSFVVDVIEINHSLLDLTQQHRSGLPVVDRFLTSYTELFTSRVAPLDILVDAWNVLVACIHQLLLSIAVTDARSLAEGGTGELINSWDTVLATAELLDTRYHVCTDARMALHATEAHASACSQRTLLFVPCSANPQVHGVWVLPLSRDLTELVSRLVTYRQGLIPAALQTYRILRKTCNSTTLIGLTASIVVISCVRTLVSSLTDVADESHLRVMLDRVLAHAAACASGSTPIGQGWPGEGLDRRTALLRRMLAAAFMNVVVALRRMLGNASLSVVCGGMMAVAEVALTNHISDSIESGVVMALSIQDMSFIVGNRVKNVIGALNSVSSFTTLVVDALGRATRSAAAFRSASRFPAVMVVFIASQRLQALFSMWFSIAQMELEMLHNAYHCGTAAAPPPTTSLSGNLDGGLFEVIPTSSAEAIRFASVDDKLLAAAIADDEDRNATTTIGVVASLHSSMQPSSSASPHVSSKLLLSSLLRNCLESPTAGSGSPQFGVALLISAIVMQRESNVSGVWIALGSLVEWPAQPESCATVKSLLRASLTAGNRVDGGNLRCEPVVQRLDVLAHVLEEQQCQRRSCARSVSTASTSAGIDPPVVNEAQQQVAAGNVSEEFITMPRITQRVIEDRKLLDALRLYGLELDVVKACVLGEALSSRASLRSTADNMKSFLSLHWLTSMLSTVEDVVLRLTALFCHGVLDVSDRQLADAKSTAVRLEGFVAPYPQSFANLSSGVGGRGPGRNPGRAAGVESYFRRRIILDRSIRRSDLARGAEPFSVLNNAISVKRSVIDRPMCGLTSFASDGHGQASLWFPPHVNNTTTLCPPLAFRVEFRNVSKSFGHKNVLVDISFVVEPGEFVGIVGVSGAGKTTILQLLLRMFDPDAGCILVNDIPIGDYPVRMLRRRVAYVCQDFKENGFLKDATIEENLAIGDLSREDMPTAIDDALRLADAQRLIQAKPLGKGTLPDPKLFSGGEIQRLVISRALMRNPQSTGLLILDEATSALDGATERIVMANALRRRQGGVAAPPSCIAVAHRLATLTEATKILVLSSGRIVEQGAWRDLVNVEGGLFRQLLQLQMVRGEESGGDCPRP